MTVPARRRPVTLGLLMLAIWGRTAVAQTEMPVRLTDSLLPAVRTVLAAQASFARERSAAHRMLLDSSDADQARRDSIKAGKLDLWKWLQARSALVEIPPGAVYDSACTVAYGNERAVLTLGGNLPEAHAALIRELDSLQRARQRGMLVDTTQALLRMYGLFGQLQHWPDARLGAGRTFYESRGYEITQEGVYRSDDPRRRGLGYMFAQGWQLRMLSAKGCGSIPTGAVLLVLDQNLRPDLTGRVTDAREPELDSVVRSAGLDGERWKAIHAALGTAWTYANASAVEESERQSARSSGGESLERFRINEANARWYARHATEFDPLLTDIMRGNEPTPRKDTRKVCRSVGIGRTICQ